MKKKLNKSVLFLGKKEDVYCDQASDVIRQTFYKSSIYLGEWGDEIPSNVLSWEGDYIISYLSRWIVPKSVINSAKKAAINFHPASPDYPGIGCSNFALYDESIIYGVTCHHMDSKVDTGKIIAIILPVSTFCLLYTSDAADE